MAVPAGAANGDAEHGTVTATSVGSAGVSGDRVDRTIAIDGVDTLLVDNDDNGPDVQAYYTTR